MFPKPNIYYHVMSTRGDTEHPGKPIKRIGDYVHQAPDEDVEAFKTRIRELEAELAARKKA